MKTLAKVLGVLVVLAMFASCAKKGPEQVAEKFLTHLNKLEFAEAKKYATESTQKMLDLLSQFPNQEAKEVKIENLKCTEEGDKARCTYTVDGKEESIDLVKVDGKWLVDMQKEMPIEEPVIEGGEDVGTIEETGETDQPATN